MNDIRIKFGRSILQCTQDGRFNLGNRFLQTVSHFLITYRYFHRKGSNTVRTVNDIIFRSVFTQFGQGRTYINFDTFRHTLADLHIMLTAHIFLNIRSQVITGNTDRVVGNDTSQRDNGNLRRATTYINNHVSFRSFHVNTDTDSCSHRFENQIDITSAGMLGRVANSTEFNFRTSRRYADHHTERG